MIEQVLAEVKVLEYKLDRIRTHINTRLSTIDDPIVENELKMILNLISNFETVPAGWKLSTPLVDVKKEDC